MTDVTRICVLRSGGEYTPDHVRWLADQVPGLVALSDVPVSGVDTIPLRHNWSGWWSKLELFRPDITGDLLYLDLDTVVVQPDRLDALHVGRTTMLSDFYRPRQIGSGLMYLAEADRPAVWQRWIERPSHWIDICRRAELWGDQGFLSLVLSPDRWQTVRPGAVCSYKVDVKGRGVPADAIVVCFHGIPRPWTVKEHWIPRMPC